MRPYLKFLKINLLLAAVIASVLVGCATGEEPRWEYRTFSTVQGLNEHSGEGWIVVNEVGKSDGGHEFLVKRPVGDHQSHASAIPAPSVKTPTAAARFVIISAVYGSGTHFADVTYRVNDLLRNPEIEFFAQPGWLYADPTPGWNKALVIVYEVDGQRRVFTTGEGGRVMLGKLLEPPKKATRGKRRH